MTTEILDQLLSYAKWPLRFDTDGLLTCAVEYCPDVEIRQDMGTWYLGSDTATFNLGDLLHAVQRHVGRCHDE